MNLSKKKKKIRPGWAGSGRFFDGASQGRWEYKVTQPMLPPGAKSPVMMTWWLNEMDAQGWELVAYGQDNWRSPDQFVQEWWVFRRERKK